jgi:hypothetical protein
MKMMLKDKYRKAEIHKLQIWAQKVQQYGRQIKKN